MTFKRHEANHDLSMGSCMTTRGAEALTSMSLAPCCIHPDWIVLPLSVHAMEQGLSQRQLAGEIVSEQPRFELGF